MVGLKLQWKIILTVLLKMLDLRKNYLKMYKYINKFLELKKRNVQNYHQFNTIIMYSFVTKLLYRFIKKKNRCNNMKILEKKLDRELKKRNIQNCHQFNTIIMYSFAK